MSETFISEAGQSLIADGENPSAVVVAEMLLATYRTLRILQLMDESGHHEWEGITRDELRATLCETADILGGGEGDVDAAIFGFIEFRMGLLAKMRYADYLQTPEWRDVRRFALWRAGGRCQTCNAEARLQVHHRTYDRRGRERLSDVTVLCGGCHKAFHETRGLSR